MNINPLLTPGVGMPISETDGPRPCAGSAIEHTPWYETLSSGLPNLPRHLRAPLLESLAGTFDARANALAEGATLPLSSAAIRGLRELRVDIDWFLAKCGQNPNAEQYRTLAELTRKAIYNPHVPSSAPPSPCTYIELFRNDAAALRCIPGADGKPRTRVLTMEEAAALRKQGVPIDKFLKDYGFELDADQLVTLSDFIEMHLDRPVPPTATPFDLDSLTKKFSNLAAGLQDPATVSLKEYDIEVLKRYGVPVASMLDENQNEWDARDLKRLTDALQLLKWLNTSGFSAAETATQGPGKPATVPKPFV